MGRPASLLVSAVGFVTLVTLGGVASCGSNSGGSGFHPPPTDDSSSGDDANVDSGNGDDQSLLGDAVTGEAGCTGIQCQVVDCVSMGKPPTTVSGIVVTATPAMYGTPDPIYNAIVYVPNAPLDKFKAGVSCDQCGAAVSGSPITDVLSDVDGKFSLKNVPVGTDIPIVIQIGRWRREAKIPMVKECQDNPIPHDLTRLPHNSKEGDIPHIAIATSVFDAEECILLKMGVDQSEFTIPSQTGRIHLYTGTGSYLPNQPDMSALWADVKTLEQYDVVQFPCESTPNLDAPPGMPGDYLETYANAGGRVFATDLSYPWYDFNTGSWPGTAQWIPWTSVSVDPLPSIIDTSFPKGKALAQWLFDIGATPMLGHIDIHDTYHVVDAVNPPTTRWLYSTMPDATVQTMSFNTPVGVPDNKQCGRAVFHNSHVAGEQFNATNFPMECAAAPMTPQEHMMEFMLLDLASCIQNDTKPPIPPPM
jgi:hypothetical protein